VISIIKRSLRAKRYLKLWPQAVHFAADTESLVSALEELPDAVILFAEDRIAPTTNPDLKWMTPAISDQIVHYVENGGSWLAWHSGLASYPVDSSYTRMLRGYFLSHPDQHELVSYTSVNVEQPEAFEIMDEHYFVHCDAGRTEVFLRSSSVDGESIAGWRHPYGAGRVSCLTPAHREEGLLDSSLLSLLRCEIEWLTDVNG
jgi:type 1 glutamine amidotransferase